MLTRNNLFKFPLVDELIVYELFEIILHGFWLKILCKTIPMSITTFLQVVKDRVMIFSKLFHAKIRKT